MTDDVKALRKENLELKQRADLLEKENRALKVQLDRMQEDLALLAAWMRDPKEAINLARRQRDDGERGSVGRMRPPFYFGCWGIYCKDYQHGIDRVYCGRKEASTEGKPLCQR